MLGPRSGAKPSPAPSSGRASLVVMGVCVGISASRSRPTPRPDPPPRPPTCRPRHSGPSGGFTLEDVEQLLGHSSIVLTSYRCGHVLELRQHEVTRVLDP